MKNGRPAAILRCALALFLSLSEAGGALAGQLSAEAKGAAQLVRDALSNPARVPRLDAALQVPLNAADGVVVPVSLEDFKADPSIDRAKIDAFLDRAGQARGQKFVASPIKSRDPFGDDWGLGYQFEPWTWEKPIPAQTRPDDAKDLIVRGRSVDPKAVDKFMSAKYGRNHAREILAAATRALEGLSPAQIRTMPPDQLQGAARRLFETLPAGSRVVREPKTRDYDRDDAGAKRRERGDPYFLPGKDWAVAVQAAVATLEPADRARLFEGRWELEARFAALPDLERLPGAPGAGVSSLVIPVAEALHDQQLSWKAILALPSSERAQRLDQAFTRASGWAAEEADAAIARSRRKIATVTAAEGSAGRLLGQLIDSPYLAPAKRREAAAAYDGLRTLLYARQLRGTESAFEKITPGIGLQARRYSDRLGGILISGSAARQGGDPAASARSGDEKKRFSRIVDRSLKLFYSESLGRKASRYLARWALARQFHKPAVADAARLYADTATLGMTGEYEAVGLRGYSHEKVFADARAIFRRYFPALARDPTTWWDFENLLDAMCAELPDHFPIKFAQSMAEHLRKAALLPLGQVREYMQQASWQWKDWKEDSDEEFRAGEQEKVLADFTAVLHRALAEEGPGPDRVVGAVLTGSFVRLAARRDSDFDIQLVTADGQAGRREAFMRRVGELWRQTGHSQPIKAFPVALAPSFGLIQLVHKGPHVVIAPDPTLIAGLPRAGSGKAVEEGIFEGSGDPSLREYASDLARQAVETARQSADRETLTAPVIGYFPGLGSWEAYQGAGRELWDSGLPEVRQVYERSAAALGLPGPESLFFTPENAPRDPAQRASFIAASFLTYNVALARLMERRSRESRTPVVFQAYGGDSLGVLTAAVASGAVSVEDGARIAQFLLAAINRAQHGPASRPRRDLELSYWNVTDAGMDGLLAQARKRFGRRFQKYRAVDWGRVKAYVDEDALADFKTWLKRNYPLAQIKEDGRATKAGGYHTGDLSSVRGELARFLKDSRIAIGAPASPMVSNNGAGLITTAEGVRDALLAMVDEPMESRATAQTMDELKADVVVEIGLGDKGGSLFHENFLKTPTVSFTGQSARFDELQRIVARGPRWRKPD